MGRTLTNLGVVACAISLAARAEGQWSTASLSTARRSPTVTTIGGLAIFAGGIKNNLRSARIDIYDSTSGAWSVATLSVPRAECAATSVGPYALIAGGSTDSGTASNVIDVLDVRTMTWSTATLPLARYYLAATTVGTKALFAGGGTGSLGAPVATDRVDVYDFSVGPPNDPAAWSMMQPLSVPRGALCAATVGSSALFAGGYGGAMTVFDTVDIYDDSTGQWMTATLSQARGLTPEASATVGSRVYIGGGFLGPNGPGSDVVDIYDAQAGFLPSARLSAPRAYVSVVAVGESVLFAGGMKSLHVGSEFVDTLHASSGLWSLAPSLSSARWHMGGGSVGGKALFVSGAVAGSQVSATIDVYDGTVGTRYCGPGAVNSSGRSGTLTAFGSEAALANDLTLSAFELPPSAFGFFLNSIAQGFVANPAGSQGNLCLSGAIGRYVGAGQVQGSGASGSFTLVLDLTQTPTPGGSVSIVAGQTWNFQAWHRDANPTLTSNFTDAASVLFR